MMKREKPNMFGTRRMVDSKQELMGTYYHVVPGKWDGGDIQCYNVRSLGRRLKWKWGEVDPGFDGDIVSLHETLDDAKEFLSYELNGRGQIVKVVIDDWAADFVRGCINGEGFPSIFGYVKAEYCSLVQKQKKRRKA